MVLRSPIHANEPSEYNGMLYRTSNRVLNNGIKVIILICMDGTSQYHHHQKYDITALFSWSGKAGASLLGQDVVASLLSLCMALMTAQIATRLTLRTFKHKKRKVSIDTIKTHVSVIEAKRLL